MSRSLMLRLLESFFRRWYLYLVPVVLLGILGFLSVSGTKSKFQSERHLQRRELDGPVGPERHLGEPDVR